MKDNVDKFHQNLRRALGAAVLLALVACGREPLGEREEEGLADQYLAEEFHSSAVRGAVSSSSVNLDSIKQRVSQFAQSAKAGFQACRSDLKTQAPQLVQTRPQNREQGKQQLQAILNFFKTAPLSPECAQLVSKLKAFREKVRQRVQAQSAGALPY